MEGLPGLAPMPRKRALLALRAVNSVKNVFGANSAASLTMRTLLSVRVSAVTAVTLPGTLRMSVGSFCAVTTTGGRVKRGVEGGCDCASAARGAHRNRAAATTCRTR